MFELLLNILVLAPLHKEIALRVAVAAVAKIAFIRILVHQRFQCGLPLPSKNGEDNVLGSKGLQLA